MDSKTAKRLVIEARAVLTQWSENYFRMRKRLEDTNDQRWEFDRKPLFGKTDYMSEICANILEILEALDHFKVFLGPELKAVTGDAEGIDEVTIHHNTPYHKDILLLTQLSILTPCESSLIITYATNTPLINPSFINQSSTFPLKGLETRGRIDHSFETTVRRQNFRS